MSNGPILGVVGARPNFMKMAPVVKALRKKGISVHLVHTGQHYDRAMSEVFFEELGMPKPSEFLGIGSDTHGRQTGKIMIAFEEVCERYEPSRVLVCGDVNSTVAAALVAVKKGIPVDHVEAGLRSFDREMPEEINRIMTDHLSDLLFVTEKAGVVNLAKEGIEQGVHLVGNCMVDTLMEHRVRAFSLGPWKTYGVEEKSFGLITLHRPSNVDVEENLKGLIGALSRLSVEIPLLFPLHPRTRSRLREFKIDLPERMKILPPLSYLEFLGLMAAARLVLTDSGGIQEETTALGTPCMTLRENTERPITVEMGTNHLVGVEPGTIVDLGLRLLGKEAPVRSVPPLWDGRAAERIADLVATRV